MTTFLPRSIRGLDELFRDVERAFWTSATPGQKNDQARSFGSVDVTEKPDCYLVHMDVPGVKKENLELTLEGQMLRISANMEQSAEHEEKGYLYRERSESSVSRAIPLPKAASDEIDANLKDGVLTVEIKKAPEKTTKKIAVK